MSVDKIEIDRGDTLSDLSVVAETVNKTYQSTV